DGPAVEEELLDDRLQVFDQLAQTDGPAQFAEQVAGNQQEIDLFLLAVLRHPFDGPAQVLGAVDAPHAVAQMPIGGMEYPHHAVYCRMKTGMLSRLAERHLWRRGL